VILTANGIMSLFLDTGSGCVWVIISGILGLVLGTVDRCMG